MANRSKGSEAKDALLSVGMLALVLLILMAVDERVPNPFAAPARQRRRRI